MTKIERRAAALGVLAMACAPVTASAAQLFSDNFDAGTSAPRYVGYAQDNDAGAETAGALADTGSGPQPGAYDVKMDFNFNYGAFTHFYTNENNLPASRLIPQAPRSGVGSPTIGLKLEVNNPSDPGGTGTAVLSLYPKIAEYAGGLLPSGDVKLTFDMWMNYNGPYNGGAGSTEFFTAGIQQQGGGIGGGIATGDPGLNGMALAIDGEAGNVTFDYRFYQKNTRLGGPFGIDQEAGYVAQDEGPGQPGPGGGFNNFYESAFPFTNPGDPNDVWYETAGAPGKHWTTFEVINEDGIVYYYAQPAGALTKTLIAARTDEHTNSGNAMVGYADFNAGTAGLDAGADHSFAVFDNIVLESLTYVRPKWNVNASGNWSDPGNWLNGVPNANIATADFTDGISGSGKTINVDSDKTVRAMIFDNAQPYTINSTGGKIILDSLTTGILGTIKVKSGSHTINANVDTNRIVWTDVAAGSTLTINGNITGTSANRYLQKTGAGTLVLGGSGAAWTGDTRVQAGTVRLAANNAIPNNGKTTVVTTGATLDTNGFNFTTGRLRADGGSIIGSGTATVQSHVFGTGGGTISANVNFAPAGEFIGHRELISSTAPLTLSGNISGTPKLHQYSTGTNPTIVLSGTNTYTGATAVRGGNLVVTSNAPSGAPGALGNSTAPVEVGDSTVTPITNVRVASTASVGGTYAGGNTLTFGTAVTAVDGVTLADGDRILLKNQVDPVTGLASDGAPQNGVWVRTNANLWTRATDFDETSEMIYGTQVTATAGTANIGRKFYLFQGEAMNTSLQIWGQEIQNAALLTGAAVTVGRDVNVLNGTAVAASVYSLGGNSAHNSTFSGTVTLSRPVTLTAAAGGTVNFTGNLVANNNTITKAGDGTVKVKNLRTGTVAVSAGTLGVLPDASAAGTSKVTTLTVAAGAKFDLARNKLITADASGSATAGVYSGVQGLVQKGLNGGGWDGAGGIVTSEPDALNNLTTIGVATGAEILGLGPTDTAVFAGQTINGNSTVAMYTYAGDLNLDGTINPDDYANISFNDPNPGATGYYNGDINYDGDINADDFATIDFNFNAQGPAFPTADSEPLSVTAVPEPSGVACLVAAAAASLGARRRRRNRHDA